MQPSDGTEEPKTDAPTGAPAVSTTAIRLRYTTTKGDIFRAGMFEGRRSDLIFAFGLLALVAAAGSLLVRDVIPFLVMLTTGIAFVTGAFSLPFVWWAIRQRPDLVGTEAVDVIDEHGIHETLPKLTADLDWSLYREVSETRHAFYLSTGMAHGWIPKRAFTEPDLAAFRQLIAARGLLPRRRRLRRVLVTVVVVAAMMVITVGSLVVTRLTTNPRLDLSPAVAGRAVSVHASTDLPDGALISIEIIHIDEYAKSIGNGGLATVESPWVRYEYVSVKDGGFDVTFDASGWPAGRGRAVAFFDLTIQPGDVIERYGARGERLSGQWVKDDPDDGRELEVVAPFTLE